MSLAALGLALRLTISLTPASVPIVADGHEVTLGQVADLSRLPARIREHASSLVIAAFQGEQARLQLPAKRVVERARALMPMLAPWLPAATDEMITVSRSAPRAATSQAPSCLKAVRALATGSILALQDFVADGCDGADGGQPLRYQRGDQTIRARRDIARGEVLSVSPHLALAKIQPGQRLFVSAQLGPVVVQREVRALQAAAAGRDVFVRATDGGIFSAPAPGGTP